MDSNYLVSLVTVLVSLVLGEVSKKLNINKKLIPIQNLLVGVIICLIDWIITKDFSVAIGASGLIAGGAYDIVHNLQKLKEEK